ncbi:hypothetical protein BCR43DRAFT_500228 [Syncephalastrum racemosum]|uniref:Uncharacterized protein n=1 Tax=Syncephalastrum racemosum TaxID=13706 RepID=A0A1X2GYR4_SYNRA|nr:hypothetical protein BCR43DRAFT_500228 [Syncephalastrum racemosum]
MPDLGTWPLPDLKVFNLRACFGGAPLLSLVLSTLILKVSKSIGTSIKFHRS